MGALLLEGLNSKETELSKDDCMASNQAVLKDPTRQAGLQAILRSIDVRAISQAATATAFAPFAIQH